MPLAHVKGHLDNLNTSMSCNEDTELQSYGSVHLTLIQHNIDIIARTENNSLPVASLRTVNRGFVGM